MNYYNDYLVMQSGMACRGIVHTVVKGDNLYRLGKLYGVPLEDIFEANPKADIYNLKIGDKICIPMNGAFLKEVPGDNEVIVEKTQKLSEFLQDRGLSLSDYEQYNPKVEPQMLKEGTKVRLPRRIKPMNMT